MNKIKFSILSLSFLYVSCSGGKNEESSSNNVANPVSDNAATNDNTNNATANNIATNVTSGNDGFFTGFDGVTDYSILIPRLRNVTIQDPSIATVTSVDVNLSQATIDKLVAQEKASNPDFDDAAFSKFLTRKQSIYKIIPLKVGKTVIVTSGGRGGPAGRGQKGWNATANIDLIVNQYTPEQLQLGKTRYTTDGGGNLKACASCHETGEHDAPPHELGDIMQISDADAVAWITQGKDNSGRLLRGKASTVTHTWEFADEAEQNATVAYLRSLQTKDVETLTSMIVTEQIANGGFMKRPKNEGAGSQTGGASGTTGN